MIGSLLLVIGMLLLSAFFSGMEVAYFGANKFKIELKNSQGEWTGQILSRFLKNTPRFISTILIGNNIALVVYGISAAHILDNLFLTYLGWSTKTHPGQMLILQTAISTFVVLILGEYLPKIIVRRNPDAAMYAFAYVMQFFYLLFKPLVAAADVFSRFVFKYVFQIPFARRDLVFQKADLQRYIEETMTDDESAPVDAEVFSNALDFNKIRAREFMAPRTEIVALPIDATVEELKAAFIETELSRLVIYDETLDNIRGYVHNSAMFKRPKTIGEVVETLMFVPESMPANVLLSEFNRERKPMAIVLDEFGGTAGLVTVEDLVEVVFGDIEDEHDDEEEDNKLILERLGERLFRLSGRHSIDDLNDELNIDLPEGDYATLSGFVQHYAERIPQVGETVPILHYIVTIEQGSQKSIDVVKLEYLPPSSMEV